MLPVSTAGWRNRQGGSLGNRDNLTVDLFDQTPDRHISRCTDAEQCVDIAVQEKPVGRMLGAGKDHQALIRQCIVIGQEPERLIFAALFRRQRDPLANQVRDRVDAAVAPNDGLKRVGVKRGHHAGAATRGLVGLHGGKLNGTLVE